MSVSDPLPTPPSHAFGQLTGLSSDYEENPFDAVFAGQKASGPQAAVSGLGSNGEPGSKVRPLAFYFVLFSLVCR